jgi:hypothetical protein
MSREQDAAIAADMALAAIDNRESWEQMTDRQRWMSGMLTIHQHQRGARTGAPLYLSAHETALRRTPIWILED